MIRIHMMPGEDICVFWIGAHVEYVSIRLEEKALAQNKSVVYFGREVCSDGRPEIDVWRRVQ